MSPAEPAGGGVVARVLLAALKWAKSRKSPEISESEFIQIARVTIFGNDNTVEVSSSGGVVSGEQFADVVQRCFDAVLHQPGLRISYTVGADGARTIRIDNVESYQLPAESEIESYTRVSARRELPAARIAEMPIVVEAEVVEPTSDVPSIADIETWTGNDYAKFTEHVLGLPDEVDLPALPRETGKES